VSDAAPTAVQPVAPVPLERGLSPEDLAQRAGVDQARVDELLEAGILGPDPAGGFTAGDVRRVLMFKGLLEAGLPLAALADGVRTGILPLDFADSDVFRRLASLTDETFEAASQRTGIPLQWLAVMREASGWGRFEPNERLREDERDILPWLEVQARLGFRAPAVERLLRAMGDGLRRLAEAEGEWFRTEIADPFVASGRAREIAHVDPDNHLSDLGEQALLAMFRAQEAQTWVANIIHGFQGTMALTGLHQPVERHPAICFLDITGYTRLTQEQGDQAAADLAEQLARLVKRTSAEHAGRPVKWLGDGVMFYFRDPGPAVVAALEMVDGVVAAGLPPAHVGVHAGPVVVQEGDYYGQTVNMAARIAEYARPGEVLVSRTLVDAAGAGVDASVSFSPIGNIELKGVVGPTELLAARRVT
jgi:adenylate cyclase